MDDNRFDRLTRAMVHGASRRTVVRGFAGGALGVLAALLGVRVASACHGTPCNVDGECCAGTNCLLGRCNPCSSAGTACSTARPCCRGRNLACCAGTFSTICVDTRTNNTHCGRCGNNCGKGRYCSNGLCCPTGTVNRRGICCAFTHQNCNGVCKNLQTDVANCGTCGTVCPTNSICSKGKCCPRGTINCGGSCVNLQTNPDHCGQCGNRCPSRRCIDRQCVPLET